MCDVGCESRSCLDTSLDNCSSERDNDSTVFSHLVLCVLSAFFSVSGTYRCSILKIKTMTKNFITQEKRRKIGRKSWHLSVWSSFHNCGQQRWPGVQRYELCQNPVAIQWLGVLIFALATMHSFSGVRTMEKMLVQSLSTLVHVQSCHRCRHQHSVLQTTAAGYNCCYQPSHASWGHQRVLSLSFHSIGPRH